MPSASAGPLRLAPLLVIGALLPALFVALDTWLLDSWSVVLLMAALVAEVGLMGLLCANLIRPRWLMWIIYAWMWLVMDLMVLALAISDPWYGESVSPNTLPAGLLGGQLGLVIVWAAFGRTRWNIRWPAGTLIAIAILVPTLWHHIPPEQLLILVSLQNAIFIAVCACLAAFGFRLSRLRPLFDSPPGPSELSATGLRESQFQLRDVIIWTTVLAVALAVARAIGYWTTSFAAWEYVKSVVAANRTQDFLLGTPTAAFFTALVLLVALWAALGSGTIWLRCLVLTLVCLFHAFVDFNYRMTTAAIPILLWLPDDWGFFLRLERSVLAWHYLTGGMLFAALLMFRSLGFRLCRATPQLAVAAYGGSLPAAGKTADRSAN